jgi:uncharacterized protein
MSHQPVIDGLEFAKAGSRLQGAWPVAEFQRLRDVLRSGPGTVRYVLEGSPDAQGYPALRLKVDATLPLLCQRCLAPFEYALRGESLLRLVATQAEVDAAPIEPDGPESIMAGKEMQVRALVEDEVLLAIPIAPRHEACEAGGKAAAPGIRQRPFAGLRGLMGSTKH